MKILFFVFGLSSALSVCASPVESFNLELQKNQVRTLEQALTYLPLELRRNFTLIKNSLSLQSASELAPRVILFSKRADFIVAFNHEAAVRGGDKLEMIQFNHQTQQAEMFSLGFTAAAPQLSEKNPRQCLTCHGPQGGYLWNSYSRWPNAYGGMDDDLMPNEQEAFLIFRHQVAPTHPRYKILAWDEGSPTFPYREHTKSPSDLLNIKYRANGRLGMLLSRLQARHLNAAIAGSPEVAKYAYTFLHQLICGPSLLQSLKQPIQRAFAAKFPRNDFASLAWFEDNLREDYRPYFHLRRLIAPQIHEQAWQLAIQRKGDEILRNYVMGHFDGERHLVKEELSSAFFGWMAAQDPELARHYRPISTYEWSATNTYSGGYDDLLERLYGGTDHLEQMDQNGLLVNLFAAQQACAYIEKRALKEWI